MTLWLDSKFVADGLCYVLEHRVAGDNCAHLDLWQLLVQQVQQLGDLILQPRWIPSHLDSSLLECAYEDWVCHWNHRIDRIVGVCNVSRPAPFFDLYAKAIRHHESLAKRLRQLRAFFAAVAEVRKAETTSSDIAEPAVSHFGFDSDLNDQPSLNDLYIDDLLGWVQTSGWVQHGVPHSSVELVFRWMIEHSDSDYGVDPVSYVEFVFLFNQWEHAQYPFWNPQSQAFSFASLAQRFERPTLAQLVRVVKKAVGSFLRFVDAGQILFSGADKSPLGIHRPMDGIFLCFSPAVAQVGCDAVKVFFASRPLRRACDMARPL
eukprot:s2101_g4.t1